MQHQFNLGPAVQPAPYIPRIDEDAPLLASVEGVAVPLSGEEVVFQTRGRDEAQVLTTQVLQVLDQCRPFRSLEEHIAVVVRRVPGLARAEGVRKGLEMLQRTGLLVRADDLIERGRSVVLDPVPLAGLCIRTCDRPGSLERLLGSLAATEQQHGMGHRVILLDDSRSAEHARRNAALLHEYAATTGAPVHCVGATEQAHMAAMARAALPEAEAAIHAFSAPAAAGFGGGRTWNLALLLTAGRRFFLLDDDFELPLRRHPQAQAGVSLAPDSLAGAWFCADEDAALHAGEPLDTDPFAVHLQLLGRTAGEGMATGPWRLEHSALHGLTLRDARAIAENHRLATTFNGTRGHTGTVDAQPFFLLGAPTRERMCTSRETYLRNLAADNVVLGRAQAQLAAQGHMTPFGIDNSQLLPCTRAAGRNEDALFDTLLRFCHPQTAALHLPLTVGHAPEDDRGERAAGVGKRPWSATFNTFACDTLMSQMDACISADPAQRLRFAAALYADIAGADEAARVAHLREYLNYRRGGIIARLQEQLVAGKEAPIFWQADVRAMIAASAKAMAATAAPRFDGWPEGVDAGAAAERLRAQADGLAAQLRAWPDLWHWAAEQGSGLLEAL